MSLTRDFCEVYISLAIHVTSSRIAQQGHTESNVFMSRCTSKAKRFCGLSTSSRCRGYRTGAPMCGWPQPQWVSHASLVGRGRSNSASQTSRSKGATDPSDIKIGFLIGSVWDRSSSSEQYTIPVKMHVSMHPHAWRRAVRMGASQCLMHTINAPPKAPPS